MSAESLRAENVTFEVDGVTLIESIGLDAAAGSMVGIIGPNGSGKSTFVRLLYRALKPDRGTVWIDDDELWELPSFAAARRLAAVPQESVPDNDMRVIDMVLVGRIPYRQGFRPETAEDLAIVADSLDQVGMHGFDDRRIRTLSGGERQRVMIARALAQQPRVIVLDEPTNHLDLRYQHELLGLLRHLPLTVVMVLHDVNLAAEYCDQLVVLDDGRVHCRGPVNDVLTSEVLHEVFGVSAHPVIHPITGRTQLLISAHTNPSQPTNQRTQP